jgi:hypothetical protein
MVQMTSRHYWPARETVVTIPDELLERAGYMPSKLSNTLPQVVCDEVLALAIKEYTGARYPHTNEVRKRIAANNRKRLLR